MDRRNFLKTGAALVGAGILSGRHLTAAGTKKSVVMEIEGPYYKAVNKIFAYHGGIVKLSGKAASSTTVLIKPNICMPHNDGMGTVPSSGLIDALCKYLTGSGVKKIYVADHTLRNKELFRGIDLVKAVEKYPEAEVILADEQSMFSPVKVNGKILKNTEVLNLYKTSDLLINVPVAKHHSSAQVSLSLKNLMGMIWDRRVFHRELGLAQAIADLALVIKPGINIIDATHVLLNGGPAGPGPVITDNRIFAGTDMPALDSVVASRYEFAGRYAAPEEIAHLAAAHNNDLGEIDLKKITVKKFKV